jgi:broad specificity phosphatase PhoE
MRIGLMRHFPVKHGLPSGWVTAQQLMQWRVDYDASEVTQCRIDAGPANWQRCLASDLSRAYVTAQAAYAGPITQTALLREAEFLPFRTGRLLLPVWVWRWVLRVAWMTAHASQRAARDDFRQRVRAVAEMLEADATDTLVVSHAGTMAFLRKELVRRGFRGPGFRIAAHARLYMYERA